MRTSPIPKVATTIRLELPLLERTDNAVLNGKYASNNDFITKAITEKLDREKNDQPNS